MVIALQSDQDLQGWLATNDFSGLLRLPDSGYVPVDKKEVRRVRDLVEGKRYYAVPSRGGIKSLRATVQDLNNYTKNQASKSEGELEEAILEYGPRLLGWPLGVAVPVRIGVFVNVRKPALSGHTHVFCQCVACRGLSFAW